MRVQKTKKKSWTFLHIWYHTTIRMLLIGLNKIRRFWIVRLKRKSASYKLFQIWCQEFSLKNSIRFSSQPSFIDGQIMVVHEKELFQLELFGSRTNYLSPPHHWVPKRTTLVTSIAVRNSQDFHGYHLIIGCYLAKVEV